MKITTVTLLAMIASAGSIASAENLDIEVSIDELVTIGEQDIALSTLGSATTHTEFIESIGQSSEGVVVHAECAEASLLSTCSAFEPIEHFPVDLQEQAKVQDLLDANRSSTLAGKVLRGVFQTASLSVPAPGGAALAFGGLLVMARRRR